MAQHNTLNIAAQMPLQTSKSFPLVAPKQLMPTDMDDEEDSVFDSITDLSSTMTRSPQTHPVLSKGQISETVFDSPEQLETKSQPSGLTQSDMKQLVFLHSANGSLSDHPTILLPSAAAPSIASNHHPLKGAFPPNHKHNKISANTAYRLTRSKTIPANNTNTSKLKAKHKSKSTKKRDHKKQQKHCKQSKHSVQQSCTDSELFGGPAPFFIKRSPSRSLDETQSSDSYEPLKNEPQNKVTNLYKKSRSFKSNRKPPPLQQKHQIRPQTTRAIQKKKNHDNVKAQSTKYNKKRFF